MLRCYSSALSVPAIVWLVVWLVVARTPRSLGLESVDNGNNGGWDRFSKGLQIQQSNRFSVAIDFPGSNGTDGSDWTQLSAAKSMLWPSRVCSPVRNVLDSFSQTNSPIVMTGHSYLLKNRCCGLLEYAVLSEMFWIRSHKQTVQLRRPVACKIR